jgi:FkbM family methyltransferase
VSARRARPPSTRRFKEGLWYGELVRERWRFALREGLGAPTTATYRLQPNGLRVRVRHGESYDRWVLHEVFRGGDYDPPEALESLIGREPRRIVDLGANVGFFSLRVLGRHPLASVVAFEPDPSNAASVRTAIRRNGLEARWELVEGAAATEDGELRFVGGLGSNSHQATNGEEAGTIAVRALDVFPHLDDVDLLKIDIEGGEWAILGDERFARVRPRAVVLEYHSLMCPSDNPKRAATELLRAAGYTVRPAASDNNPDDVPFWGMGVIWAWRSAE